MNPPTKFALMRAGRARLERSISKMAEADEPAPAVPTMEIDGVRYKEAPLLGRLNDCTGCAFKHEPCNQAWQVSKDAFGDNCEARRVIYIRAD